MRMFDAQGVGGIGGFDAGVLGGPGQEGGELGEEGVGLLAYGGNGAGLDGAAAG